MKSLVVIGIPGEDTMLIYEFAAATEQQNPIDKQRVTGSFGAVPSWILSARL